MKLNLAQFLLFIFVSFWVIGDVTKATYLQKLYMASFMTIAFAYLNNAHGIIYNYVKGIFKKI